MISGPTSVPASSGLPTGKRGVCGRHALDHLVDDAIDARSPGAATCTADRRCRRRRRSFPARPARCRLMVRRWPRCCRRARGCCGRTGRQPRRRPVGPCEVEPVALINGTPGGRRGAAPTSPPPSSTWLRCAGAPTASAACSNSALVAMAVSGVRSLGFQITGLPHTIASAAFQLHTATGKLKAVITPVGPSGCHCLHQPVTGSLAGDRETVQLSAETDGEVADVDHLLHLAERLALDLADLDLHQSGEVGLVGAQQHGELADQFTAQRRRCRAPRSEGRLRVERPHRRPMSRRRRHRGPCR